jgi:hypothetical protein
VSLESRNDSVARETVASADRISIWRRSACHAFMTAMALESKNEPLLPAPAFARRILIRAAVAAGVVAVSLAIGTVGYHLLADLGWVDSLYNAAMILTGMGPVAPLKTDGAKLFATGYALFSGVIFLASVGFVLTPMLHRALHRFHLDEHDDDDRDGGR